MRGLGSHHATEGVHLMVGFLKLKNVFLLIVLTGDNDNFGSQKADNKNMDDADTGNLIFPL